MRWHILQAVVAGLVLSANIHWQLTPNLVVAAISAGAAAWLVTEAVNWLLVRFRSAQRDDIGSALPPPAPPPIRSQADRGAARLLDDRPPDGPSGRFVWQKGDWWIVLTMRRAGSNDWVTLEMSTDQWYSLPPVRRVLEDELKRRGIRLRSRWSLMDDSIASEGVPSGYIERRDQEDWVVITAHSAGQAQPVTCEISFADWLNFGPVQLSVEDELEQREAESYYRKSK